MYFIEFDEDVNAIINPKDLIEKIEGFPKVFVSCFSKETFDMILDTYTHKVITSIGIANLSIPLYEINYNDMKIGLFNSYVGASGCVAVIEEIIAMGMEKLVIFGTCGVLDASIEDVSIIIPTSAIREEGTSFHYAPSSHEIEVNLNYKDEFINLLDKLSLSYHVGKVWTTDAFYRETKGKMEKRKQEGCICVDMECSALAALSSFRNIPIFHFFYSADNLDHEEWNPRSLDNTHKLDEKHRISEVALEFASSLIDY